MAMSAATGSDVVGGQRTITPFGRKLRCREFQNRFVMPKQCAAVGCNNRATGQKTSGLTFHGFPFGPSESEILKKMASK